VIELLKKRMNRLLWIFPAMMCLLVTMSWAESVRLAWDPNPEGGVAGYHVYRTLTSGIGYTRLTASPVSVPYYVDRNAVSPGTYYYATTAVDASGNESALSGEIRVDVGKYDPNPQTALLVVRANPDAVAEAGQMVTLSGSVWNPEGKSLSYVWNQTLGPAVTIIGVANPEACFFAPALASDTTLEFRLTVADGTNSYATDSVQINVSKK
jgi:hypothetical protein